MTYFLFTQTPLKLFVQSLWRDEAFSFLVAQENVSKIILLTIQDYNPPLYYLILHFWLKIFGSSEISLRTLSFLFYWATIYLVFLFLIDIFKVDWSKNLRSKIFFILYLLLFIFNPQLVFSAFEARTYSLLAFLVTLSFYSLYRSRWKLYLWSMLLGLYTHYSMLLVFLSQFLLVRLVSKKKVEMTKINQKLLKPFFWFIPWVIFILLSSNFPKGLFWFSNFKLTNFFNLLGIVFTGHDFGFSFKNEGIFLFFVSLLLNCLVIFAILRQKKKVEEKKLFIMLLLWALVIPSFVAIISFVKPVWLTYYLNFSTVGLILFIVFILQKMPFFWRAVFLIILLIFSLEYQSLQIKYRKKPDLRKSVKEIGFLAKKNDRLYVTSESDFFTAKYYLKGSKSAFNENNLFIYGKSYEEIASFLGKILISKKNIASSLPHYPKKAFILKSDGSYDIQSLF